VRKYGGPGGTGPYQVEDEARRGLNIGEERKRKGCQKTGKDKP
jgi:hypothetical protein